MDSGDPSGPMLDDKERFLKKIQEWRELGFDTNELEDLLENDFDEFLRRRHEVLKHQVDRDKDLEEAYLAAKDEDELVSEDIETAIDEPPSGSDLEPELTVEGEDDELLLLGEPLPPEDEAILEEDDEAVIFVGKFQKTPKSRVHRSRGTPEDVNTNEEIDRFDDEHAVEPEPGQLKRGDESDVSDSSEVHDKERSGKEHLEEGFEDSDDYEEYDEYSDEDEERVRQKPRRRREYDDEEPSGSGIGKVIAAIVAIIVILAAFYLFFDFPTGTESSEKITAIFEISPSGDTHEAGSLITFDATSSSGEDLKYNWDLGSDFKVYDGSKNNKKFIGYYTSTENLEKTQTIKLEITGKGGSDSITKQITIKPRSFSITGEKIGDSGDYKVTGNLLVSNPDGIQNFEIDQNGIKADVSLTNVDLDFETKDTDPMTLELKSSDNNNVNDGFLQAHSVFERVIAQNLDLSGTASGKADVKETGTGSIPIPTVPVPFYANLDGTMTTVDKSYTDLKTYNTIYGMVDSDMDLSVNAQLQGLGGANIEQSFSSDDMLESYPNLQKSPSNLRLVDLTDDELSIGDQNGISVGDVLYVWNAQKIEYIFDRPVIKVNLTLVSNNNDEGNNNLKIEKFFFSLWIAEDVSIPVKTHLYSVQKYKDNETTINYVSEMTDFIEGSKLISNEDCSVTTVDGHYYKKHPDYIFHPSSNWSYLAPTGSSNKNTNSETSFDAFTPEQAIQYAKNDGAVNSFLQSHPNAYVVEGYCTAKGDEDAGVNDGVLHWSLTFGNKDSKNGLRVITTIDGPVYTEEITIDRPVNSTADFEPILSFGSAEDIFNEPDLDFYDFIFDSESKVDFDTVTFGIQTNLQYPNLDLTSIMFAESSRYAYLVTFEKDTENGQQIVNIALDAETGQLLYYFNHSDDGFNLFQN